MPVATAEKIDFGVDQDDFDTTRQQIQQLGQFHNPVARMTSPARDQQLRLERDVFHSLSERRRVRHGLNGWMKGGVVVGVSVVAWAAVFGAPLLLSWQG